MYPEAVSVEESKGYTFPSTEDLENFTLPNGTSAKVQLPQSLLEARANGKLIRRLILVLCTLLEVLSTEGD